MVTPEERESIIQEAAEKALLMLPKVIDNLLKEKVIMNKMRDEFYKDNEDFKNHKQIVTSVLEQIETKNPGKQYNRVLEDAVPEIKRRIGTVADVNLDTVSKPINKPINITPDHGDM